MTNNLQWEIPLGALLSSQKGHGRKNTTLICVTRRMIRADFNLKQQFDSMSFRMDLQNFKPSHPKATVTHDALWKKFCFAYLYDSFGNCGSIYDNKNLKCNCLMNNDMTLI